MAQPRPRKYASFDELVEGQEVHLRGPSDDEDVEPRYRDAKYLGGTSFFIPSLGYSEQFPEVNYIAWSRHRS